MLDRLTNALKAHAASQDNSFGQSKFGIVASVNSGAGTARVMIQPEGVLSGWLPISSQWVGNGWGMVCLPQPGDQVLLVPQDGDIEQGIIIGRTYSLKEAPPAAPVGEFWLIHQSGSFLKLCNDGTIQMSGDLHVQGDIYDKHGALSSLRACYNEHIHNLNSGGTTASPVPQD